MSQPTVSIDLSGAARPAPVSGARPTSGASGREFAAHLRQAGRDDADSRPTRGVRSGAGPTGHDSDDQEDAVAGGAAGACGSSGGPAGDAVAQQGAADGAGPAGSAPAPSAPTPDAVPPAGAAPTPVPMVAAPSAVPQTAAAAAPGASPGAGTGQGTSAIEGIPPGGATTGSTQGRSGFAPGRPGGAAGTSRQGATIDETSAGAPDPVAASAGVADPATMPATGTATTLVAVRAGDPGQVLIGAATHDGGQSAGVPTVSEVSSTGSATAAAAPAPTMTSPQSSVAGQLAASLRTLPGREDGVHVMTVRLHPDELGPVRVVARLTGTDVHLRVTTSTVAAAEAVTAAGPRLHEALAGSGLTATGVSVDHDADLAGQQLRHGSSHGSPPDTGGGGRAAQQTHRPGVSSSAPGGRHRLDDTTSGSAARHPSARTLDLHV